MPVSVVGLRRCGAIAALVFVVLKNYESTIEKLGSISHIPPDQSNFDFHYALIMWCSGAKKQMSVGTFVCQLPGLLANYRNRVDPWSKIKLPDACFFDEKPS